MRSSLLVLALLLLDCVGQVRGQSALDGFDPNADGLIRVVVVQPDGKILIGGDFTTLSPNRGAPVTRNRIARLNPDGTLDAGFDPNANNSVYAIALQADGRILVSGAFSGMNSIGGQSRNRIARLDPISGAADSFNPSANGLIVAIAVQADGKILVGGAFQNIGGQARNYIARLDATTGLADSFDPHSNSLVLSIAVQADGKILAGGAFAGPGTIGGQVRNHIVRLDPATGLADPFDPNASSLVQVIAIQSDGKILVGGTFIGPNSIGGATRNRMARLDPTTGLADSFDPNANNQINSIAAQSDGKILVGGLFGTIGGQWRSYIARLDAATGLADSFDPNASGVVNSIAVQSDGKVLAVGSFITLTANGGAAAPRNNIARLETDGRLDQTLGMGGPPALAIAVQADGKILIGGFFNTVLGVTRNNIARLNTDGTLDTAFDPDANGGIYAIAVQADGKILAGGDFTSIGGQTRVRMARLDPTTGLADSFDPNANNSVFTIASQADGKILAGGLFTNIGGQTRNRIARLDAVAGLADSSFDPNANGAVVESIAVQADGKILAGGQFTSIGGQTRNRIARLDATTALADSFSPNANSDVVAIAVQAGKILAGGLFTNIGGQTRLRIARLDASGPADSFNGPPNSDLLSIGAQADGKVLMGGAFTIIQGQGRNRIGRADTTGAPDSFNPNANDIVYAIATQADGKILAGGQFTSIGGQPRSGFARVSNDTAALQSLGATQSGVTWTRGGSSPDLTRVTFESSTDNVNYTPLGNGTPFGSNWNLSGLSLPTGQKFYIRARGWYRGGYHNGSESITEYVRSVLVAPAPTPTRVGSRKLHSGVPFDIDLPLKGASGIECRSDGAANNYQVVFTFPTAVTFNSAALTGAAGSVSGTSGSGTTTVAVNLTGVTSPERFIVTLFGINDGTSTGDVSVHMGLLVGDVNGNGVVNSGDAQQTRSRSGQTPDATNFRSDVNVNGAINSGDTTFVKVRAGTFLP